MRAGAILLLLISSSACRAPTDDAHTRRAQAEAASARGDWVRAAEYWYADYEASGGRSAEAAVEAARAWLAAGEAAGALAIARRATLQHPEDVELHSLSGEAALELGDAAAAASSFEGALAIDPERVADRRGLALAYLRLDRPAAVLELSGREVRDPELALAVARARQAVGDVPGTFRALATALEGGAGGVPERLWAGELALELAGTSPRAARDASRWLEETRSTQPQNVELHRILARLQVVTGRLEAADESFRRAAELDPGDADVLVEWIRLVRQRGAADAAHRLALHVQLLDPDLFEREGLGALVEPD